MRGVAVHIGHAPLREVQVLALGAQSLAAVVLGHLQRAGGILVFHHQLGVGGTALGGRAVDGDHQRQRGLDDLHAAVYHAADGGLAVLYLEYLLGVGYLVQAKLLRHLRPHLGGVAVDGLAAADDEVNVADLLDGRGQGVARGQRVCSGEEAVGEQPAGVGAAVEAFTYDFTGTRWTHGQQSHRGAGVLLFDAERLLQGI